MTDTHNRFLGNRALSPETLMMGYGYDPFLSERSLKPPVFHTSTFVFRSAQDGKEFFELAYGLRQKRPNEEPGGQRALPGEHAGDSPGQESILARIHRAAALAPREHRAE